jgi:hypothetical protein
LNHYHCHTDKRVKLKNDRYNLSVRVGIGNDNMYLKFVPLTSLKSLILVGSDYRKTTNEVIREKTITDAKLYRIGQNAYRVL